MIYLLVGITPRHLTSSKNHEAAWITQSRINGQTPMYSVAKVSGSTQVVGVADTGVDDLSCFFRDDTNGQTPRSTYTNPTFDTKYRKVIQYVAYADSSDSEGTYFYTFL